MFSFQYHMLVSHILSAVQHKVSHVPNVVLMPALAKARAKV